MRTKEVLLWPFFIWPFSVWVQTHTEYGIKVLIFFLHHLWKSKILKRIFWSWNMFDTLSTTRKKAHFFQQVPSLKYCKKSRLIWSLEKSKTTFLIWWKNHQKTFLFTQKESNILWWFCFCGSCQMIKLHFCFWRKCSFR